MASSASESALPKARRSSVALALPRVGDLWPYLFLALLTILSLTLAYAQRPVVRVDLGGDYDSVFVSGFNGREIDAVGGGESYSWVAGESSLTLPGGRSGVWMALLHAAPGQPADVLRGAAISVNGERVDMPRRTLDSVLAAIPPEIAAADELRIELVSPLVGDPAPANDIVGEVVLSQARTYRWSTGESTITLPNLGRGDWNVTLDVVASHPSGEPLAATISAQGVVLVELPESAGERQVSFLVPAALVRDGTLELEIRSKTFVDPRELGVLVSDITVAPAGTFSLGAFIPPLGGLALALFIILGLYASLSLMLRDLRPAGAAGFPWSQRWALIGVSLAVLVGAWMLASYRFPSSFLLPRLSWLMLWSILLLFALRWFIRWLFRAADVSLDAPARAGDIRPGVFLSLLLLFFFVSYWIKAVGALYPYFVAIDVHWHMTRSTWILNGQLPVLYGINSPLNESTMPTAEWGENRPVIPYSPWFHMFATIFAFTPMSMSMAANMFSLLIDSSRLILIALIARKAGLSLRVALFAAVTYAVLPVTYLLHSWGNIPTTFGLWLTLVTNTLIFVLWDRLHHRGPMILVSFVFLLTFLMYTVTGVFLGVFLVSFTILLWLNGMRGGEWAALRRPIGALWQAAGVAIALSLVIYYGQYVLPIIERTIPYMGTVFTQGPQSVGVERPPLSQYLLSYIPHLDYHIWPGDYLYYGLAIPLLFTIPGFIALRRKPLAWVLFATWGVVAILFLFAGYRISMVDKQLFYLLPVICICWAIYAERYWLRGWPGRFLVVVVLLFSMASALDQWLLRIVTSPVAGS